MGPDLVRVHGLTGSREQEVPLEERSAGGGLAAQLQLPDLPTRLQGLAVAPDRLRWVYASPANLRRRAPSPHFGART